jgi:two-component system OmpR family response regulator
LLYNLSEKSVLQNAIRVSFADLIENNLMQSLRRILLVEDDPELSAEIADFLATEGYQIDQALTGDEGLRLGQANPYAVMLIDRMLPGLDGLSVNQRLRNDGN